MKCFNLIVLIALLNYKVCKSVEPSERGEIFYCCIDQFKYLKSLFWKISGNPLSDRSFRMFPIRFLRPQKLEYFKIKKSITIQLIKKSRHLQSFSEGFAKNYIFMSKQKSLLCTKLVIQWNKRRAKVKLKAYVYINKFYYFINKNFKLFKYPFSSFIKCIKDFYTYSRTEILKVTKKCKSENYGVLSGLRENGISYLFAKEIIFGKVSGNKFQLLCCLESKYINNQVNKSDSIEKIIFYATVHAQSCEDIIILTSYPNFLIETASECFEGGFIQILQFFDLFTNTNFSIVNAMEHSFIKIHNFRICSVGIHCKVNFRKWKTAENYFTKRKKYSNDKCIESKLLKIVSKRKVSQQGEKKMNLRKNNSKMNMSSLSTLSKKERFLFLFLALWNRQMAKFYLESQLKNPECSIQILIDQIDSLHSLFQPSANSEECFYEIIFKGHSCNRSTIEQHCKGKGIKDCLRKACCCKFNFTCHDFDVIFLPSRVTSREPIKNGEQRTTAAIKTKARWKKFLSTCSSERFYDICIFMDEYRKTSGSIQNEKVASLKKFSKLRGKIPLPKESCKIVHIFLGNASSKYVKTLHAKTLYANFKNGGELSVGIFGKLNIFFRIRDFRQKMLQWRLLYDDSANTEKRVSFLSICKHEYSIPKTAQSILPSDILNPVKKTADRYSISSLKRRRRRPFKVSSFITKNKNTKWNKKYFNFSNFRRRTNSFFITEAPENNGTGEVLSKFKKSYMLCTLQNLLFKWMEAFVFKFLSSEANPRDASGIIIYISLRNVNCSLEKLTQISKKVIRIIEHLKLVRIYLPKYYFPLSLREYKLLLSNDQFQRCGKFCISSLFSKIMSKVRQMGSIKHYFYFPRSIEFSSVLDPYFGRVLKNNLKSHIKFLRSLLFFPKCYLKLKKPDFQFHKETFAGIIKLLNATETSVRKKTAGGRIPKPFATVFSHRRRVVVYKYEKKLSDANEGVRLPKKKLRASQCIILRYNGIIKKNLTAKNGRNIQILTYSFCDKVIPRQKFSQDLASFRLATNLPSLKMLKGRKDNFGEIKCKSKPYAHLEATIEGGSERNEANTKKIETKAKNNGTKSRYYKVLNDVLCKYYFARIALAIRRKPIYREHSKYRLQITFKSLLHSNFLECKLESKQEWNKRREEIISHYPLDNKNKGESSTSFPIGRNRNSIPNFLRNLIGVKKNLEIIKKRNITEINNGKFILITKPSLMYPVGNKNMKYEVKMPEHFNERNIRVSYPANGKRPRRSIQKYEDIRPYLSRKSRPLWPINIAYKFNSLNVHKSKTKLNEHGNSIKLFKRQNLSILFAKKSLISEVGKVNVTSENVINRSEKLLEFTMQNSAINKSRENKERTGNTINENVYNNFGNHSKSLSRNTILQQKSFFPNRYFSPRSNFVKRILSKRMIDNRAEIPILGLFDLSCGPNQHFGGYSEKAAAILAIRHINEMKVIPGHKLVMHINDTKCDNGAGVDAFFHAIYTLKSRLVLLLGAASADVTESLARVTPYWNLVQIAFGSETPTLSDRSSFPLFFRTVAPDSSHNDARVAFLQHLNWDAVATLSESNDLYTLALNELVLPLENSNISLLATVTMDEQDNIGELLLSLKKKDCRIFFGSFSQILTRKLFCEVYNLEMYGPDYAWLLSGHSEDRWWRNTTGTHCTHKELLEAAQGSFLITAHSLSEWEKASISNMTSTEFAEEFASTGEPLTYYVTHTYDAVWAGALALKKIAERDGTHNGSKIHPMKAANWGYWGIKGHRQKANKNISSSARRSWKRMRRRSITYNKELLHHLRPKSSSKTLLKSSEDSLHSLTSPLIESDYSSSRLASELLYEIQNLEFQGVSGPLSFAETNRIGVTAFHQIQDGEPSLIGLYHPSNKHLDLNCIGCVNIEWRGGQIPIASRLFMTRIETINPLAFIIMSSLSCFGIIIAILFLIFNLTYRRLKCIKLSSPRLNNITVIGCIFVYTAVLLLGLDHATLPSSEVLPVVCTARAYLLSAGFSLAFGSMFTKTYRVHQIFTRSNSAGIVRNKDFGVLVCISPEANALFEKGAAVNFRVLLQDTQLISLVIVLLVADVMIVSSWAAVDPMRRELHNVTVQISPRERGVLYQLQVEVCESFHRSEWLGALYVYKGLLVTVGAYMAWETRHVKIPALNDSQYIGMSVYNVVITSVIVLTTAHIVKEQITLAYVIITTLIITSTTTTLCLLFIPKILAIFRRIEGDPVVECMGLKIESNTRRLLAEDKREKFYRAEVRNRVYKREVLQLEVEIVNLVRCLEAFDNSSTASSMSENEQRDLEASGKQIHAQVNTKRFEDLKKFYNFQGISKRSPKAKFLQGDDASIRRAKRARRSRLLHRSLPSLVVTPVCLPGEEESETSTNTPTKRNNVRVTSRSPTEGARQIPPSPHPLQKARVVRRKLPDNLNDNSEEDSDSRENVKKDGKRLGDGILDLRYTLNFSTPLLHELSLFISGSKSSKPRVSFSDIPVTHCSSNSPPLTSNSPLLISPPSTPIYSSSSSQSGSLILLPPYPSSSLSCLEHALKSDSCFQVIDPPSNFAANTFARQSYRNHLSVPPKPRSFSQPTIIASAFCSFLKKKAGLNNHSSPITNDEHFFSFHNYERSSLTTFSPLSMSPLEVTTSSTDLKLNIASVVEDDSVVTTVAEYQVKDLDILCPFNLKHKHRLCRTTPQPLTLSQNNSPQKKPVVCTSKHLKRLSCSLASGK